MNEESGSTPSRGTDWHFSHLGRDYFADVVSTARIRGMWPIERIATGKLGEPYREKKLGRRINPNWEVETTDGRHLRSLKGKVSEARFIDSHLHWWPYELIAREYDLPTHSSG